MKKVRCGRTVNTVSRVKTDTLLDQNYVRLHCAVNRINPVQLPATVPWNGRRIFGTSSWRVRMPPTTINECCWYCIARFTAHMHKPSYADTIRSDWKPDRSRSIYGHLTIHCIHQVASRNQQKRFSKTRRQKPNVAPQLRLPVTIWGSGAFKVIDSCSNRKPVWLPTD